MAEYSALAAGKDGREFAGALGRDGMADEIDAAVQRMQAARSQPVVDRVGRQSGLQELGTADDSPLTTGELRNRPLTLLSDAVNPALEA